MQVTADPAESAFEGIQPLQGAGNLSDRPVEGAVQMENGRQSGQSDSLISKSRQSLVYPAALLALLVILVEWGCISVGVQFDHPWVLLLLLPLAIGAFYAYRTDFRLKGAAGSGPSVYVRRLLLCWCLCWRDFIHLLW